MAVREIALAGSAQRPRFGRRIDRRDEGHADRFGWTGNLAARWPRRARGGPDRDPRLVRHDDSRRRRSVGRPDRIGAGRAGSGIPDGRRRSVRRNHGRDGDAGCGRDLDPRHVLPGRGSGPVGMGPTGHRPSGPSVAGPSAAVDIRRGHLCGGIRYVHRFRPMVDPGQRDLQSHALTSRSTGLGRGRRSGRRAELANRGLGHVTVHEANPGRDESPDLVQQRAGRELKRPPRHLRVVGVRTHAQRGPPRWPRTGWPCSRRCARRSPRATSTSCARVSASLPRRLWKPRAPS
jgi:hypothetical protein